MSPYSVQNQRDRFKVWTGNLGALKMGRASLDFRLEESTLMRTTVLKLLEQLQNKINSSKSLSYLHKAACLTNETR